MELKNIKIEEATLSKSNPRPATHFKGAEFDELVESIKEKGVLVPILVRSDATAKMGAYEVVAGARRFEAAKKAGLGKIPAQIIEMDDVEAREAQIIENLQRRDIHPLDEGEAYRTLIEKSSPRYEVKDVAAKVGKSETYVRQRLALTNLSEKAAKAYRADDITAGQAVLIARLEEEKQQNDALKQARDYGYDTERLHRWITERVYTDLSNKPWAKDAKLAEMVGDAVHHTSLFGEQGTIDPVEHARQMAAFIEIKMRDAKEKGQILRKICTSYGRSDTKGALEQGSYKVLHSKEEIAKATSKDEKGIVVEGSNIGQIFRITTAKEDLKQESNYKPTPAEKAKRKAEREKAEKEKEKKNAKLEAAVGKITWPLSEKHLDALLGLIFGRFGYSYLQPVASRHEIKAIKTKSEYGYTSRDLEKPLREWIEEGGSKRKIQFIFEVALEANGGGDSDHIKKI